MEPDAPESSSQISWQQQRQEAIRRQQQRWQQQGGDPTGGQQQQPSGNTPQAGTMAHYPSIPAVHSGGSGAGDQGLPHYPEVPAPSAPPLQAAPTESWDAAEAAAAEADLQRRQQQEDEDHRLAMQLAEQFASEDGAGAGAAGARGHIGTNPPDDFDIPMNLGMGSDDMMDDDDWEQIRRTASMARDVGGAAGGAGGAGGAGAAGAGAGGGRPGGASSSAGGEPGSAGTRPSSQAAAAAGSTAGALLGAGLSALLAMAAQAAAASGNQQAGPYTPADVNAPAAGQHNNADAGTRQQPGGQSTSSDAGGAAGAAGSGAAGAGAGGAGGTTTTARVLGTAASALRAFLASRAAAEAANQSSSSSAAAAAAATGSTGGRHADDQGGRRWEDEQPGAEDLHMLHGLMQQLMTGNMPAGFGGTTGAGVGAAHAAAHAAAAAAGGAASSSSGSRGGGGSSGFQVTRLPGGGIAATYSSSTRSGPGGVHVEASAGPHHGGGDHMAGMFANPDDFLSQLLLAGARSAHANSGHAGGGAAGGGGSRAGFTHFDPNSGATHFEPLGGGGQGPFGLDDLLGAIMGPGLFSEGNVGMRYEDLVGLDPVHVTTPEEVLSSLPQSKFVEGRRPGDSDTCVVCQTSYAVGDDLTHLPCLHAFHTECITPWLQGHSRKCPVCKTDVC